MKKSFGISLIFALVLTAAVFLISAPQAEAATYGDLTYTVTDGNVTITDCSTDVAGALIIPDTIEGCPVTTIGAYAFFATDLSSVEIPDSVTTIGAYAFFATDLSSVEIPDSVTTIGESAFHSTFLSSVTIPESVTTIGAGAFGNCWNLTGIWVDAGNPNYSNDSRGFLFNKDKSVLLCALDSLSGSYTIPDGVITIGNRAFSSCNKLTSVIIPDSVTAIGTSAFGYCDSLTSITIGDSVTAIGDEAFRDCESLKTVKLPDSVTVIGASAFYNCGSLTSINIPDGVTSIGNSAFYWCDALVSIVIPGSVTTIGDNAFVACEGLVSVTIGNGVKAIGADAFRQCSSLTSVVVPNTVTSIGKCAFDFCKSLKSITLPKGLKKIEPCMLARTAITSVVIPNGVTIIGTNAFTECTDLTTVTIPNTVTTIDVYAFCHCNALEDVYYGGTAEQWKKIDWKVGYNGELDAATVHYKNVNENEIGAQPESVEITAGFTAQFTVEATDIVSYRWQYRRNENAPWCSTTSSGYKTDTLSVKALLGRAGYQYRCKLTGSDGTVLYTEPATMTVNDSITITSHPSRQTTAVDETGTFTIVAEGTGLTYQWQYRKTEDGNWMNTALTGCKTDALTVTGLIGRNGYQYRCAITDENGIKVYTRAATLSVIGFTSHPADQRVSVGETAVFLVVAKGQELTYQWQYRKTEDGSWMTTSLPGAKTDTLTVPALANRDGYQYRCRITDALGIVCYSDPATLYIE